MCGIMGLEALRHGLLDCNVMNVGIHGINNGLDCVFGSDCGI